MCKMDKTIIVSRKNMATFIINLIQTNYTIIDCSILRTYILDTPYFHISGLILFLIYFERCKHLTIKHNISIIILLTIVDKYLYGMADKYKYYSSKLHIPLEDFIQYEIYLLQEINYNLYVSEYEFGATIDKLHVDIKCSIY